MRNQNRNLVVHSAHSVLQKDLKFERYHRVGYERGVVRGSRPLRVRYSRPLLKSQVIVIKLLAPNSPGGCIKIHSVLYDCRLLFRRVYFRFLEVCSLLKLIQTVHFGFCFRTLNGFHPILFSRIPIQY